MIDLEVDSPEGIGVGSWFSRELTFPLEEEQEVIAVSLPALAQNNSTETLNYPFYVFL